MKAAYLRREGLVASGIATAAVLILMVACSRGPSNTVDKSASPAPEATAAAGDLWVASHAMTLSDVLLMLRGGDSQEVILAEVRRRHFVGTITEPNELELTANGARHKLIAALKDKENWITEAQEQAYGQLLAHRPTEHRNNPTPAHR